MPSVSTHPKACIDGCRRKVDVEGFAALADTFFADVKKKFS